MYCQRCSTENAETSKFCVKCGTALGCRQGGSTEDVALKSQADVAAAPTAVVDKPSGDRHP